MQSTDDSTLLRQYAENHSDEAFAALVARHVNLVYSVALRQVGNPHHAEEITQAVFIILARKAAELRHDKALSSWLFQAARLTAGNFVRSETRRHRREQEAYMQTILDKSENEIWPKIAALLDTAVANLNAKDRRAIVLRFYEGGNLSEVGVALGVSEDAAKKRVARALEKLQRFFSKRGVTSTTATLVAAISANSVQAAPAMLAKAVTTAAMVKGTTASASTLILAKGALKLMAWQKLKTTIAIGVVMILAASATALVAQRASQPNDGIPYKMADDIWQLLHDVNTNKLEVRLTITPVKNAVKPTDMHIIIQSAIKGPISVALDTNGQVINFPHEEALRRENPTVMVSQRNGNLTVFARLPIRDELTFRYRRLGDGVAETSRTIAKANKVLIRPGYVGWANYTSWLFSSPWKLKVEGLVFVFPKSGARKATVEIMAAAGPKTYRADANGQIKLKLDPALLLENPEVKISETPQFIVPNVQL